MRWNVVAQLRRMSMAPTQAIRRMQREQLSELLLSKDASKVAVIDVRGDDHVGGHIHTSQHVPSTTLDHKIPELVRTLAEKQMVVFHCALSQERGPRAAQRYMEEREKKMKSGDVGRSTGPPEIGIKDGGITKVSAISDETKQQEVFILDKGFVGWQEKYAFCST